MGQVDRGGQAGRHHPKPDGDGKLRKAKGLDPALLLLDIMVPGPDGLQVCRTLRRRSAVPIVLLTARTSDIDKIAGLTGLCPLLH